MVRFRCAGLIFAKNSARPIIVATPEPLSFAPVEPAVAMRDDEHGLVAATR